MLHHAHFDDKGGEPPFAAGCVNDRVAGQSRLMRVQRNLPPLGGQVAEPVAALQHGFSKAAVQNGLTGRNLNRPFAAHVSDVSVADKTAVRVSSILNDVATRPNCPATFDNLPKLGFETRAAIRPLPWFERHQIAPRG
jgi:hypothetical protein